MINKNLNLADEKVIVSKALIGTQYYKKSFNVIFLIKFEGHYVFGSQIVLSHWYSKAVIQWRLIGCRSILKFNLTGYKAFHDLHGLQDPNFDLNITK